MSRAVIRRAFGRRQMVVVLLATAATAAVPSTAAAATRYLSPSGNDAAACTAMAPCRSFDRGYRVAAAGDVVEMAGGSYGGQSIPAVGGRAAPAVSSGPRWAPTCRRAALNIDGSHVTVRDVTATFVNVDAGSTQATGATVANVTTGGMWINNVRDLRRAGREHRSAQQRRDGEDRLVAESYNVTFDGVDFHDATATDSQRAYGVRVGG